MGCNLCLRGPPRAGNLKKVADSSWHSQISGNTYLNSKQGAKYPGNKIWRIDIKKKRTMSLSSKAVDVAFQGAGIKIGLEIWCIENLRLAPVPKSSHGKFFSGSSYIILNTVLLKTGVLQHDIHYWLGKDAKEVDSAMASDKAVELDAALGCHAVQYREVQGYETEKFLSYFKPCIIPIEGEYSSEFGTLEGQAYRVCLLTCKGDHVVRVREVPFSRSSLNHTDVFILDTESKIFLFSGCDSSIQERAKALEVVQFIKDNKHLGRCDMATIEDGKFVGDSDVGEFWSFFGGYAPITRVPSFTNDKPEIPSAKLFWITQGKCCIESLALKKETLNTDKCYMLDCDMEIFIWMGRNTTLTERKTAISATEDIVHSQGRSSGTHITFITEGSETTKFKTYFDGWPQTFESNLYEEGRGKVAALFKQQGFVVKELPEEESEPFIDCTGFLRVWRVNDHNIIAVPVTEQGKLFSGDCYIVQYTYLGHEKEENLLYAWFGRDSITEDRIDAISYMITMVDSVKAHPVLVQIFEGKEPIQFFAIFQTLIVFKGGLSTGYKRHTSEKKNSNGTYDGDGIALFRIQGSSPECMQAIQVDPVSRSLNSSYCYILHTGSSVFTWTGNLSSPRDHDLLDRMLDRINQPNQQPRLVNEGSEPDAFWNVIGGKTEYPREKEIKEYLEEPHLFACILAEGDFKVKEIFNFTQDDLTTEDVLLLDCHHEIYMWIGNHSNFQSKQQAFSLGKKFVELDILLEGLSLETAIYVIIEGHEPPFFTRFFKWDSLKASMLGNSFEKKLAILKGTSSNMVTPKRTSLKAYGTSSSESTPDRSRSKSVNSNRTPIRSKSPAFDALASTFETPNSRRLSAPPLVVRKLLPRSSPGPCSSKDGSLDSPVMGALSRFQESKDGALPSAPVEEELFTRLARDKETTVDDWECSDFDDGPESFPYECLKVSSNDPVTSIDITKREAYLSNEVFQSKFGMTKKAFYKLPKWKQNKHKMALDLF